MLVQKQATPARKNILVIILILAILAGGWTVWKNFFSTPEIETPGQDLTTLADDRIRKVTEVNTSTLSDDRLLGQVREAPTTFTDQLPITPRVAGVPLAPENIEINNVGTGSMLAILWELPEESGADTIRIYRSASEGVEPTLLATVSSSVEIFEDHTVTDGIPYYYRVVSAVAATNVESASTSLVQGISLDTLPPDPPADVSIENIGDGTSVKVSWIPPKSEDFTNIRIYRSEVPGRLGDLVTTETLKGTSFTDLNLVAEVKYYYTVTAVDEAGNESVGLLYQTRGRRNPFEPQTF